MLSRIKIERECGSGNIMHGDAHIFFSSVFQMGFVEGVSHVGG
jgi:hypothetical protein